MARPWGILLLDKPSGPTSHDMVYAVRRGTGEKRVGHAGTLDPLASGLLVMCLGSATRLSPADEAELAALAAERDQPMPAGTGGGTEG